MANLKIENELRKQGHKYIVGIDEVGLGSIAGPVFACAIILDFDKFKNIRIKSPSYKKLKYATIRDSKMLTDKERNILYPKIQNIVVKYDIGQVSPEEIDRIKNIVKVGYLARERALENLRKFFIRSIDYILVDGPFRKHKFFNIPYRSIVKGDQKSFSIAAASIIAKVERDDYMRIMHYYYPEFGFKTNVGYRSPYHWQAIKKYGYTIIHRMHFINRFIKRNEIKKYSKDIQKFKRRKNGL